MADTEYTDYIELESPEKVAARAATDGKGLNRYGLDPQQEKYAQLRAEGRTPKDCIAMAALPIKNAMLYEQKHPLIKARISMLQDAGAAAAVERVAVDKQWVVAELLRQYEANGTIVQAFDKMGNETNAPQKANEAIKCLELIGKELGMFVDKKEIKHEHFDGISDDELTRIARELSAQLGLDKGTEGAEEA